MKKIFFRIFTISLSLFSCQENDNINITNAINTDITEGMDIDLEEEFKYGNITSKNTPYLPCGKGRYKIINFQLSTQAQEEIANGEVYRIAWFNEEGKNQEQVFRHYSRSYSVTAFMASYREDNGAYRYHWKIKKDSDNIWIKNYPRWASCTGKPFTKEVDIKDNDTTEAYYFNTSKSINSTPCGEDVSRPLDFIISHVIEPGTSYILEWYGPGGITYKHEFGENPDTNTSCRFVSYRKDDEGNRFYWKYYIQGQEAKAKVHYAKWPSCTGKTIGKILNTSGGFL